MKESGVIVVFGQEAANTWLVPGVNTDAPQWFDTFAGSGGARFLAELIGAAREISLSEMVNTKGAVAFGLGAKGLSERIGNPNLVPPGLMVQLEEREDRMGFAPVIAKPLRICSRRRLAHAEKPPFQLGIREMSIEAKKASRCAECIMFAGSWDAFPKFWELVSELGCGPIPTICVAYNLPGPKESGKSGTALQKTFSPRRMLITDTAAIRETGHQVREENSIEAVASDVISYFRSVLEARLRPFTHLIVRLRLDAVLLFRAKSSVFSGGWSYTLICGHEAIDYRQHYEQGLVFGCKSILAASIVNGKAYGEKPDNLIGELKAGIQRCLTLYYLGYPIPRQAGSGQDWAKAIWKRVNAWKCVQDEWRGLSTRGALKTAESDFVLKPLVQSVLVHRPLPSCLKCALVRLKEAWDKNDAAETETWSLLRETLSERNKEGQWRSKDPFDLALVLAREGPLRNILEKHHLRVLQVGLLVAIERMDIDSISSLQRLFRRFQEEKHSIKPISLAVFGEPGSGKSFAVTQIAKGFSEGGMGFADKILEFNVSQFSSLKDLGFAFQRVRDECLGGKIPVVFFDEFDAEFEGRRFGWMKYFLMPMQDGQFLDADGVHHVGRSILVFAGGINLKFSEFAGRVRDAAFCDAKGPDFLSRLRGYYNVPSLNESPEDELRLHMIRRALVLRSFLVGTSLKPARYRLKGDKILRALLRVPRFRYGARSIQAILEMNTPNQAGEIDDSSLPRRDQLDIHVDPVEFRHCMEAPG